MELPKRSGKQAYREAVKNLAYLIHKFDYSEEDVERVVMDANFQVDSWIAQGCPKEKRTIEAR